VLALNLARSSTASGRGGQCRHAHTGRACFRLNCSRRLL
jgi:hypothetical protein